MGTLAQAQFTANEAFRVKDYLKLESYPEFNEKMLSEDKSLKTAIGFTFTVNCLNKSWKIYKRRNDFYLLYKKLRDEYDKTGKNQHIRLKE